MALLDFIQKNIVTALIIDAMNKTHVFGSLVNKQSPAGLGRGSSYDFPGIDDIDVGDYTGADIATQDVTDTKRTLTIDQSKFFSFYHDKVDDKKAAYATIGMYTANGVYKLGDAKDQHIAAKFSSEAGTKDNSSIGSVTTPIVVNDTNALDFFGELKEQMDDDNVPQQGRWATVPGFLGVAVAKANIDQSSTTDEMARRFGFVANYMGINIFQTNNLEYNKISVITFDADFVTSNTIDLDIDGVSMSQVTFATSHTVTAEALRVAILAMTSVNACTVDSTGRIFTISGSLLNAVTSVVVAAGASQAGSVVTQTKSLKYGQHVISSNNSSLIMVDTLSEMEFFGQVEKRFAAQVKGLDVYGTKVKDPSKVIRAVVSKV